MSKSLSNCELYINVPENNTISLYFASMDIRLTGSCTEETTPLKVFPFFFYRNYFEINFDCQILLVDL